MKILHICPGYLQRQLYDKLFTELQSTRISNEVFGLSVNNPLKHEAKSYPSRILSKKFSILDRIFYFRKQYVIFGTICKEYSLNEFDIIHCHTLFSSGLSAYLLHKKYKLPYIITIRNTDINVFFKYMLHLRGLGRMIMKNAQNIIFLSSSYRDYVIKRYFHKKDRKLILDKCSIIPNGIDNYFLRNKFLQNRNINNKLIKLIYIGEIYPNKNIETTIKACKLLIKKGYNVNYTIVGEILNSKYHKIFSKNNFINYHPKCSKEDVVTFLRDSDIFILPSIYESFGLVYAEAMSQGLPVIYSKGQGFDGQFENGEVGYAVNCYDYLEIVQRIFELYNNYQLISSRCILLVNKFNWSNIAKEYKKIYQSSISLCNS